MPILTSELEYLVVSFVTIAYGLRWERYYTAWISVVMNVVFTAVLLASATLPLGVVYVLIAYVILGVMAAKQDWRPIFFLFGTKTFGALSLTVALSQWTGLRWTHQIIDALGWNMDMATQEYLVAWVVIALIVHVIGIVFLARSTHDL